MSPTGRELQRLLAPLGVDEFLARHWEREPVHIPGAADKFAELRFDLAALERAIREADGRDRMRVRYVGRDNRIATPPDPDRTSIRDGEFTVCVDWVDDRFETLAAYCAGIKTALSLPGNVFMTCYASPDGRGFATHWDSQASFILQIEGSKRWRFSPTPAVAWPPTVLGDAAVVPAMTERYPWMDVRFPGARGERGFVERLLGPGDVLFLPAGTWHRASAVGYSLALTMACVPMSAADFVDDVIRGELCGSIEWRRSVPPVPMESTPPDRLPPELERFFDARLAELRERLMSLRASDMFQTWAHHVASFGAASEPTKRRALRDLKETDTFSVSRTFPIRYARVPGARSLSLYYLDNRIDLRDDVLPLIRLLLRTDTFSASDAVATLAPRFGWRDVQPVLKALVHAGVLRVGARTAGDVRADAGEGSSRRAFVAERRKRR